MTSESENIKKRESPELSEEDSVKKVKINENSESEKTPEIETENDESEDSEVEKENEADQSYIFKRLYLKRITRENHGKEIKQISFNPKPLEGCAFDATNIVATVGNAGVTIYDNEHCGNHFDIMAHFILNGQGYAPVPGGGVPPVHGKMMTMCWMKKIDDAIIATAGEDKDIHILSFSYCKEIILLKGHKDTVKDLIAHPINNNVILSSSSDSTVRIWDVYKEQCLCIYNFKSNPEVSTFNTKGDKFYVGTRNGNIYCCDVPEWIISGNEKDKPESIPKNIDVIDRFRIKQDSTTIDHKTSIDSISMIDDNVLSKDIDGNIYYWNSLNKQLIYKFSIFRYGFNRCRIGISNDKQYFCVGIASGSVFIYDLKTGKKITIITHKRSTKPIGACVFSKDNRSIIYGNEDGMIWRYDYVSKKLEKEWKNWKELHQN